MYDPATTVYDPSISNYVRTPFPNNTIPLSRFDPISKKILDIAQSTLTAGLRKDVVPGTPAYWMENYYQSGTSVNPNNKYSIKIDHSLNMANRLSAYIGYSKRESVPGPYGPNGIPGILNTFSKLADTSPVYRGSWDCTINPHIHNRFYFGINQFKDSNYPLSEGLHWKDKICIPNVGDCDRNLPLITTSDFGHLGRRGFQRLEESRLFVQRRHHLQQRPAYLQSRLPIRMRSVRRTWPAERLGTRELRHRQHAASRTKQPQPAGCGFASFELGLANGGTIHTPRRVGMLWRYHAMYFQDDWRITPRLTVNLGIRYEFNPPTVNRTTSARTSTPRPPIRARADAPVPWSSAVSAMAASDAPVFLPAGTRASARASASPGIRRPIP